MQNHHYKSTQPKDIDHLLYLLNTIYPVSEALRTTISSNLVSLELNKDALLIAEGETALNGSPYMYIDQSPVSGTNYYRLKFLNADGTSGYSKIVSAVKKDVFGVWVFPNPVKSELTIQRNGETNGAATVTLYDIEGKQYSITKMSGSQITVSLSGLPAGLYLVRYRNAQHRESFTVIKE